MLLSSLSYFLLFPSGFSIPTNKRQRSPSPSEIDWNSLVAFSSSPVRLDDLLSPLSHTDMIKYEGLATANEHRSHSPTGISSTVISSSPTVKALNPRKIYSAKQQRKIRYQKDKANMQSLPPEQKERTIAYRKEKQSEYRARLKQRIGFSSAPVAHLHQIRQLVKSGKATEEQKQYLQIKNAKANEKKRKWRANVRQRKSLRTDLTKIDNSVKTYIPLTIPKKPRTKRPNARPSQ